MLPTFGANFFSVEGFSYWIDISDNSILCYTNFIGESQANIFPMPKHHNSVAPESYNTVSFGNIYFDFYIIPDNLGN